MGLLTIAGLPGRRDINGQFNSANIRRTLGLFKGLYNAGNYQFGALTAAYNNYVPGSSEYNTWMQDAGTYPQSAQDKIKNCIIQALTHKDQHGHDDPIKVTIKWSQGSPNDVTCTFDPSVPCYTIDIIGFPSPPDSALSERREKKA